MAHRSGDRQTPVEVIAPRGWALVRRAKSRAGVVRCERHCSDAAGRVRAHVLGSGES